jgi:hypothetical protein
VWVTGLSTESRASEHPGMGPRELVMSPCHEWSSVGCSLLLGPGGNPEGLPC